MSQEDPLEEGRAMEEGKAIQEGTPVFLPGESHGRRSLERLPPLLDRASLIAELVKNLPAMQETWGQSLGWEDPLEKG